MGDHEAEARAQSNSLEVQGNLPYGFTVQHYPLSSSEQRELRRLKTAGLLATSADTYIALARERQVPKGWLEQRLRQLGIR